MGAPHNSVSWKLMNMRVYTIPMTAVPHHHKMQSQRNVNQEWSKLKHCLMMNFTFTCFNDTKTSSILANHLKATKTVAPPLMWLWSHTLFDMWPSTMRWRFGSTGKDLIVGPRSGSLLIEVNTYLYVWTLSHAQSIVPAHNHIVATFLVSSRYTIREKHLQSSGSVGHWIGLCLVLDGDTVKNEIVIYGGGIWYIRQYLLKTRSPHSLPFFRSS